MTYNELKPGSVLVTRNDVVGAWLVIGLGEHGNEWIDLLNNCRLGNSGTEAGNEEIDLDFYELFEP